MRALRVLVVWHLQKLLTLRKSFLVICTVLVALPLALAWAWPDRNGVFAIGLVLSTTVALRLGLILLQPIRDMICVVQRMQGGEQ